MKLVKSLLLGSVAGLAAVAGAQAADLPVKKAAAVEYVRVCSTYGAGFFYIPGTDTCIRIGGRVRADYLYLEPTDRDGDFAGRDEDAIGFRARARLNVDARTATAYGLLRTYIRMEMTRNTGAFGFNATASSIEQAFVQFGGLTAGRAMTFFDNGDIDTQSFGTLRWSDQPNVNLLAYTFSFGNGFSASLSLEEGRYAGYEIDLAGQRMPDVVANVRYAGTWGSAQLSGALHQIRSLAIVGPVGTDVIPDTEYGFAVSGQVNFNLPMLAPGDSVWLSGTYANGALGYLGFGSTAQVANVVRDVVDAYYDANGNIDTGRGWQVAAGLRHYWTPELRSNLFGSYARVEYGGFVPDDFDFNEWRAGTNLLWSPVTGLTIGGEVLYANIDPRGTGVFSRSADIWEARLRVQRDF